MCGVFGVVIESSERVRADDLRHMVERLYGLSESRGKEAAGLVITVGTDLIASKAAVRGAHFIRLAEARRALTLLTGPQGSDGRILAGHTRMVTNGDPSDDGNNQPVVGDRVAVIHNGIIVNDLALWEAEPGLERHHEVDTEVFLRLVERTLGHGSSLQAAVIEAVQRTSGANTFAVVDPVESAVVLATTNGSMYIAVTPDARVTVFASERAILERLLRARAARRISSRWQISQLAAGTLLRLASGDRSGSEPASLAPSALTAPSPGRSSEAMSATRPEPRHLADAATELRTLLAVDAARVASLRRCTRCVLPETFPGLTFDAEGTCSACRGHRPMSVRPMQELTEQADRTGRILVPLSGGRDSCFAAHYLTQTLGLDAVAYTYDWGMVTDLARRNISRMCGALGIEHVLISADIARKRSYIRQNIAAWLRRPHLGTVPLFMAGDKHFFFHAQRLRKQMDLDLVVFSMNPFERTDFKAAFAGVGGSGAHEKRHYDLRRLGKARIAAFYAAQAVVNPAFLNASIADSIAGYLSYYAIPKRFESLYDFLPWREEEIDEVLLGTYDWETSPDSSSTWRIGDGTAPFYNYIYLKVAGFSENDTLRSIQVREGHLTRDEALARLEGDNEVRVPSLAWYFDTIGVDGAQAIKVVNAMPTLY
jgi:glutamine---fructose-6-phosphate transaminase (isomerizing)